MKTPKTAPQRRIVRPLPRRALLRGAAGIALGLPFLDAMRTRSVEAQEANIKRFFGFFFPNGSDAIDWQPAVTDSITEAALPLAMRDLSGFEAEGEWPGSTRALWPDITWVTGIGHNEITGDIHAPSMSLSAHKKSGDAEVPGSATLDQVLADQIQGDAPFRVLFSSPTNDRAITQGFVSFRSGSQDSAETAYRSPQSLFDSVFAGLDASTGATDPAMDNLRQRQASILDWAKEDAARLTARLGEGDRQRVESYVESVYELEQQLSATSSGAAGCLKPESPENTADLHTKVKQMLDLSIMAMQCDLTRVAVIQYSNCWDVYFGKYELPNGIADWSDHFVSHKTSGDDRATDLDGRADAQEIAKARVIETSRFKVRRFSNVVNALKDAETATGSLWDETLAMYFSEVGTGWNHDRVAIPILLSGGVGNFQTGRVIDAYMDGRRYPTGALHASILDLFDVDYGGEYGNPASTALPGLV